MIKMGMIHGRFQPFHIGHMDYLKSALECAKELIIGITNPEPNLTAAVQSDLHRHLPEANPFSYYQRARMIQKSILSDEKIRSRFSDILIVPFPVNKPEHWKFYIPMSDVVQLMRILDPWDKEKKMMFEKYGFKVKILEGKRLVSGTETRAGISSDNDSWHEKVPAGTRSVLEEYIKKWTASTPYRSRS